MATDFTLNASQIIRVAHQQIGIVPAGEEPDSKQLAMGYDFLDLIVKDLQARGIILSTVEETAIPLVAGQAQYTTASDTLDIDAGTPYVTNSYGTDLPITNIITRGEYDKLTMKSIQGQPTQMYVQRGAGGVSFFLYPTPDTQWATVTIPRILLTNNTSSASASTGLRAGYLRAITSQLAADLADHYPVSAETRKSKRKLAEYQLGLIVDDDSERADATFRASYGTRFS